MGNKPLEVIDDRVNGKMILRGEFSRAGEPNANGVSFSREALEQMLKGARPLVEQRRMVGTVGQTTPDVALARVSHVVTKLEMDGDSVVGEVELLPTCDGKVLADVLRSLGETKDAVVTAGFRGYGNVKDGVIQSGVKLLSYDLMLEPRPAKPKDG